MLRTFKITIKITSTDSSKGTGPLEFERQIILDLNADGIISAEQARKILKQLNNTLVDALSDIELWQIINHKK